MTTDITKKTFSIGNDFSNYKQTMKSIVGGCLTFGNGAPGRGARERKSARYDDQDADSAVFDVLDSEHVTITGASENASGIIEEIPEEQEPYQEHSKKIFARKHGGTSSELTDQDIKSITRDIENVKNGGSCFTFR